jgi:type III secretion system (T3SS) inner membrane Yop/YscD-like protein
MEHNEDQNETTTQTQTATEGKITVTWDDLHTRKVDARLSEQTAMARNRAYAKLDADAVPETTGPSKKHFFYNSIVYMAAFGILGGLLAWGSGLALQFKASQKDEADQLIVEMQKVTAARDTGRYTDAEAEEALGTLRDAGKGNPYFEVETSSILSRTEADAQLTQLEARDRSREFISNVLVYGICGLFIATCLSIAEPLTQRNFSSAITNGSVAALLGLLGGLTAALFIYVLTRTAGPRNLSESMIQTCSWGVLGLFLGAGAGVVMRNPKKLLIGMAGGLVGGLIGGALFVPARNLTESTQDSNLIALLAIGAITGIGTGLIENATRKAWLRVIAGVLAGKQFILYRNPTFIGSSPDCQIYLFKDRKVGPRHAAIHIVPGAYELEDLPLGQKTMINDKTISKTRLRHGDRITVGSTVFLFQDRTS